MAETPVRLGLLAPFGGITRIRFKGFRLGRLSLAAPPLSWIRIELSDAKSMDPENQERRRINLIRNTGNEEKVVVTAL